MKSFGEKMVIFGGKNENFGHFCKHFLIPIKMSKTPGSLRKKIYYTLKIFKNSIFHRERTTLFRYILENKFSNVAIFAESNTVGCA